jgi:hypothetical protein
VVNTHLNRRTSDRRREPELAVGVALGLVLNEDPRATDRRQHSRRRGDARTVDETLANVPDAIVKTFIVGGMLERKSAVFNCGCVAVDPTAPTASLQLLQCPTHAALQAKLRRRRTDRHEAG